MALTDGRRSPSLNGGRAAAVVPPSEYIRKQSFIVHGKALQLVNLLRTRSIVFQDSKRTEIAFVFFHRAASDWLYVVPWGIRRALCWVKDRYGNPPVYITENSFSDNTGTTDDDDRCQYLRRYINEVLKGMTLA